MMEAKAQIDKRPNDPHYRRRIINTLSVRIDALREC